MSRRYTHPTTIPGSSSVNDTAEFRRTLEYAVSIGMTEQDMEDELATRTGYGDAARNWVQENQTPNGLVRKIILDSAKAIVGAVETGEPGR